MQKVERYKHYLSIANSGPSEILALIVLKARDQILRRNHNLLLDNVRLLEGLWGDYPGLVHWQRPLGGCVAFPRFIGPGSGEAFCRAMIEESGVLLLPSSIYVSDLTDIPPDHFRIGFGRDAVFKNGLAAMRSHLATNYPGFAR